MISLTTKDFDLQGALVLNEDISSSNIESQSRRISRTETLDGAVKLDDGGFAEGDRIIDIDVLLTRAELDILKRMHRLYGEHRLATVDGVFDGAIVQVNVFAGTVSIRFYVESKLSS